MTDRQVFDLIVEGRSDDPTKVAPLVLELIKLEWLGDSPPDVINIGDILLVKVGRYLASDDRYSYRLASTARLLNGRLVP
jgi:hypothetical protein